MIKLMKFCLSQKLFRKRTVIKGVALITAMVIAVITLLNLSVKTIEIFDGEKTYTVRSLKANVANALESLELKSDSYKITKTTVNNRITTVEIAYSFPVYVTKGEETIKIDFIKGTVADALELAGFEVDEHDFVEPALDTQIKRTIYIDYTDIDYNNGNYTERIPYQIETVYSSAYLKGTTKYTEGSEGVKQINYTQKIVNGVASEKTIIGEEVITAAVNGKKIIGTKVPTPVAVTTSSSTKCVSTLKPSSPIALDKNGVPVKYKSKMTVRASAYTYTGHNCATGVKPQPGYIAVNPNVIPYGTKMYIKTPDNKIIYGYAVAADTGGFIYNDPTAVDLFFPTESACSSFGRRNVEIYILE